MATQATTTAHIGNTIPGDPERAVIYFYTQGGLGNQLFQYAAARALALRHGVEAVADTRWYRNTPSGVTARRFDLFDLNTEMRETAAHERLLLAPLAARGARLFGRLYPLDVRRERSFAYDPALQDAGNSAYLFGYWQSENYFDAIRPQLLAELRPKADARAQDVEILRRIAGANAVSVHVRRGDYVSLKSAAATHGVCEPAYYQRACALITERHGAASYFVFSDDIAWCRDNLDLPGEVHFVSGGSDAPAWRDLVLMSACRHNIIANSSFSWWGAWLGNRAGRSVIAPANWFVADKQMDDLIPERWTKL